MRLNKSKLGIITALLLIIAVCIAIFLPKDKAVYSDSIQSVPDFSNQPYIVINHNQPEFTEEELVTKSYEYYSPRDLLGRCGYAVACIGYDLMPTEERGSIGQVKPSGWHLVKYDFVDGEYLYNRCHLIGYQLTGENANEENLITGTRYLNVEGMLPFENLVADYIKETKNHVLYRVTPIFDGDNLVARGVQMEAKSVEDNGAGICFNVYVYNNQPGVTIDYATGESREIPKGNTNDSEGTEERYILNINMKKFHKESCEQAKDIKEENKEFYTGSRESLISDDYSPCKNCNP